MRDGNLSRRQFHRACAAGGLTLAASALPDWCIPQSRGDWNVNVNADVTVNGLTIPAFTWAWFGMQIAGGIVSGGAGLVFTYFLSKAFGEDRRSYEELFAEQLKAFGEMLDKKFEQETLRKCGALLTATQRTMGEYMTAPAKRDRLDFATDESQKLIAELEQFPESGYRGYMQAAGLRLAILQERAKFDKDEQKNFANARDLYAAHHDKLSKLIRDTVQNAKKEGPQEFFIIGQGLRYRKHLKLLGGDLDFYGDRRGDGHSCFGR